MTKWMFCNFTQFNNDKTDSCCLPWARNMYLLRFLISKEHNNLSVILDAFQSHVSTSPGFKKKNNLQTPSNVRVFMSQVNALSTVTLLSQTTALLFSLLP